MRELHWAIHGRIQPCQSSFSLSLSHHCYYFEQIVQEFQIWCAIKTHRQKGREEIKDQGGMNAGFFFLLIEFYTPLISLQHADKPLP